MGIGDFFKRLLSSEPAPGPWSGIDDDDLDYLWRARRSLSAGGVNTLRDEFVKRDRWFPLSEVATPYSPRVSGLDDLFRNEGLASYLSSLDPHVRAPGPVRPFRSGALVESGPGHFVAFLFPVWSADPGALGPPVLAPEETVDAVIVIGEHAGRLATNALRDAMRATGAPLYVIGTADVEGQPLPEELTVGTLEIAHTSESPIVVEATDDEGTRVLLGATVPLADVIGPTVASDVVGGILPAAKPEAPAEDAESDEADEGQEGEAEAEAETTEIEWSGEKALDVDAVVLLGDIAGGPGTLTVDTAFELGVPQMTLGHGAVVGADAQPLVTALRAGDAEAVDTALTGVTADTVFEAAAVAVVDGAGLPLLLDRVAEVEIADLEAGWLTHYRGYAAQLDGDMAAARTHYEAAAEGETPYGQSVCQLAWLDAVEGNTERSWERAAKGAELVETNALAAANHVLALWLSGQRDAAIAAFQATQTASGTWLGALLDTSVHIGDGGKTGFGFFDPTGYRHAPILDALGYLRAGDFAEGERLLRRCIELAPNHPAANGHLALHLAWSDRETDALAHCDAVLARMSHFAFVRSMRAGLRALAGDHDGAVTDLAQCLESAPDHIEWRLNAIKSLVAAGRVQDALVQADEAQGQGMDMTLTDMVRKRLQSVQP